MVPSISDSEAEGASGPVFETTLDQPMVDIFVKTTQAAVDDVKVDDVKVDDVVAFFGVRCVKENILAESNSLQTTVYRLTLPSDGPVECKILQPQHSSYKKGT